MENARVDKANARCLDIFRSKIPSLKKNNGEWIGKCPFHDDSTPSFSLHNKTGDWLYYCFGCLAKGSVIEFVQKMDNCSLSEAVKKIRFLTGDWGRDKESVAVFSRVGGTPEVKSIPLAKYAPLVEQMGNVDVIEFLNSRGIRTGTAMNCMVGYRQEIPGAKEKDWLCFPSIEGDKVTGIK
jgi:hypothetical protein